MKASACISRVIVGKLTFFLCCLKYFKLSIVWGTKLFQQCCLCWSKIEKLCYFQLLTHSLAKIPSKKCQAGAVLFLLFCRVIDDMEFKLKCDVPQPKMNLISLYVLFKQAQSVEYLCFYLKCIAKLGISLLFRRRWSAVFLRWNLRSMTCVMFSGACFLYVTFSFQSWDFNILPHLLSKNWLLLLQNLKSELASLHGRMP